MIARGVFFQNCHCPPHKVRHCAPAALGADHLIATRASSLACMRVDGAGLTSWKAKSGACNSRAPVLSRPVTFPYKHKYMLLRGWNRDPRLFSTS